MIRSDFERILGRNIRRERERCGFSMQTLGEMIGVHRNTIWRWEDDGAIMTVWELREIATSLGTTVAVLLDEVDAPDPTKRKQMQSERDPPLTNAERQLYAITPPNRHKMLSDRLRENYFR